MTMTLDDVLEQSEVMLGVGKLPTTDQLISWRKAIALHLAGMGEPVAWFTDDNRSDKSSTTYRKDVADHWRIKGWPVTPMYTAPHINFAAVREAITQLQCTDETGLNAEACYQLGNKLETAIVMQPKETK